MRSIDRFVFLQKWNVLRLSRRLDWEVTWLINQLPRFDQAIDIGANKGYVAETLARHSRKVIAFEPQQTLARNMSTSARNNVQVHCLALGDQNRLLTGSAPLDSRHRKSLNTRFSLAGEVEETPNEEIGHTETVSCVTLDSQGLSNVDFVKIDVEGYELETLKGAKDTIDCWSPIIYYENEVRHGRRKFDEVNSYLMRLNYHIGFLIDGRMRPLQDFDAEKHQRIASNIRRYANNFCACRCPATFSRLCA